MEDVLEVYRREFAADEVLVCMDETSKQHIEATRVNWRFTTQDARVKLKSLYPSIQN